MWLPRGGPQCFDHYLVRTGKVRVSVNPERANSIASKFINDAEEPVRQFPIGKRCSICHLSPFATFDCDNIARLNEGETLDIMLEFAEDGGHVRKKFAHPFLSDRRSEFWVCQLHVVGKQFESPNIACVCIAEVLADYFPPIDRSNFLGHMTYDLRSLAGLHPFRVRRFIQRDQESSTSMLRLRPSILGFRGLHTPL